MSVLDELPLDHGNESLQTLVSFLIDAIDFQQLPLLVKNAGVKTGRLQLMKQPNLVWWDVLDEARRQDKQWSLIERLKADLPADGKARIDTLLGATPKAKGLPKKWKGGPELQLGERSTLLDIAFLEQGVHVAKAVVHLTASYADGTTAAGTGFLIGRDLLLSNHHVLFSTDGQPAPALWVEARFRYERGVKETVRACRADTIKGDAVYDWAVIRLREPAPDEIPVVRMEPPTLPITVGHPTFIVQHPGGREKMIGLYRNEVRFADDDVVQYLTDTESGSSGSPVFNERWELIALHHCWIHTNDGPAPHTKDDGFPGAIRNQGVRIDRVIAGLREHSLL
jgi:hypothetical protein